ncbi:MAG: HAD-IIIC family phosphatase [Lachnospiraceae bacterium]|nr:HAD-IIIC family phosphatase [Lachnospiraceae bacterium]
MDSKFENIKFELKENKSYSKYLFFENDIKKENMSKSLKIAFLRNFTNEMLIPVIRGEIALQDVYPDVYLSEYDNFMQEILSLDSHLYSFKPDIICISLNFKNLSPRLYNEFSSLTENEIYDEKNRIVDLYEKIFTVIRQNSNATILYENFYREPVGSCGILDYQRPISEKNISNTINDSIWELSRKFNDIYVIDIVSIIYNLGYKNSIDRKNWEISKNPFTKKAMLSIGKEYGLYTNVLLGKMKKCIVLDCDNTLWGGIVGEDGTFGISIGDEYPGSAYKNFQQEIINLYNRGILIALCSKNNEADVIDVFKKNSNMKLKLEHIVDYEINWESKAENIKNIAAKLNIGLDSIVFVDDSKFECDLVNKQLPEVTVINLDKNISEYANLIRESGLFNSLNITTDDMKRNLNYKAEKKRNAIKVKSETIDEYLQSLNMEVYIRANNIEDVKRLAQMTQKTNQFNLTTIRYSDAKIKEFVENSNYDVISLRLKDDISDMGIIGMAIIKYDNNTAYIDTFLLSCRALGRGVEDVLYNYILDIAIQKKVKNLIGVYKVTAKNKQVENLYCKFGMNSIKPFDGNESIWELKNFKVIYSNYIKVIKGEI